MSCTVSKMIDDGECVGVSETNVSANFGVQDDLAMEDWKLVVKLKMLFQIP